MDAMKRQPAAPAASLPGPSCPSCRLTCCILRCAMFSHLLLSLCVSCLCVMMEKEEVCLSLRLCACLWRRGLACFYGDDGEGWLGDVGGCRRVLILEAAMRSFVSAPDITT